MKPLNILQKIDSTKLNSIIEELNSSQFKRVLRSGDVSYRSSTLISLKKRNEIWKKKLLNALESLNDQVAFTLCYEWLLNKRRPLLEKYLTLLSVKHRNGETDETFLKTIPEETLRSKARELAKLFPPQDVAIYVHFLDFHQQTEVFEKDDFFVEMLKNA